jgi:hypothetical protein
MAVICVCCCSFTSCCGSHWSVLRNLGYVFISVWCVHWLHLAFKGIFDCSVQVLQHLSFRGVVADVLCVPLHAGVKKVRLKTGMCSLFMPRLVAVCDLWCLWQWPLVHSGWCLQWYMALLLWVLWHWFHTQSKLSQLPLPFMCPCRATSVTVQVPS